MSSSIQFSEVSEEMRRDGMRRILAVSGSFSRRQKVHDTHSAQQAASSRLLLQKASRAKDVTGVPDKVTFKEDPIGINSLRIT